MIHEDAMWACYPEITDANGTPMASISFRCCGKTHTYPIHPDMIAEMAEALGAKVHKIPVSAAQAVADTFGSDDDNGDPTKH